MLTIEKRTEDGMVILDLTGKIDGGPESREIHDEVKKAVGAGADRLLLNMEGVAWINSLGVGVLIAAFVSAKRAGAALKMYGVGGRVEIVLTTNGVIPEVFEVYSSESDARASFV
jgi:anti-anti-sigma factor